jgi:hypothetical protein
MDKAQQYAGLFPFDVTGQQIARQAWKELLDQD